ncbi:MAG: 50S ribosomal protein L23 [Gammaproteobacteria bacterium]|nr:50S ribosomal protein L23 [Gammaproteobacteria bacterium]
MTTSVYDVLLAPHISEKATRLAEKHRQFVFRVRPDATKASVKAAVEKLFKVEVAEVRVARIKGKVKGGRTPGRRSDVKKAYVALKPGFDIQFATGQ